MQSVCCSRVPVKYFDRGRRQRDGATIVKGRTERLGGGKA